MSDTAKNESPRQPLRIRLAYYMKLKNYNITEMSEVVGCNRKTIQRILNNPKSNPSLDLLTKISVALDMTVPELLKPIPDKKMYSYYLVYDLARVCKKYNVAINDHYSGNFSRGDEVVCTLFDISKALRIMNNDDDA